MAPRRSKRLLKVTKTKKVVEETVKVTVTGTDDDKGERVRVTETESLENEQETEELPLPISEEPETEVTRVEIPVEGDDGKEPPRPEKEDPQKPPQTPGVKVEQRKTSAEEEETEEREVPGDGTPEKWWENTGERETVETEEREIADEGDLEEAREETLETEEGKIAREKTVRKAKTREDEKKPEKKKRKRVFSGDGTVGDGYRRYVFKVLRQVHPDLRISSMAMSVVNTFMGDMFERIAEEAARLGDQTRRRTMSAREIQAAVRLVLPAELGRYAVAEGSKAVANYVAYDAKKPKSRRA